MTGEGASGGRWWRLLRRTVGHWFFRLLVISWIAQFISSSVRPLIIYRTLDAGAGPLEAGVVAAAFSGLALFAAIPLGKAVDRRGEIVFLMLGGGIAAAALAAMLAPTSLVMLGVCSAALGLGHLSLVTAGQTMIAKGSSPDLRDSRFAWMTTVNSIAQILGPAITGFLVSHGAADASGADGMSGDLVLAIAFTLAISAVAAALSLRLRPGALSRRPPSGPPPGRGAFKAVMRLPYVPTAMLASLTVLTCIDLLGIYMPVLGHQIGLSPRTIGLLLAIQGLAAMLVRIEMVRLVNRFSRRRVLVATMTLAALSLASIPLVAETSHPVPGLAAAMIVCGLGLGLGQPATMGWVAGQTPGSLRGTAVSIRLSGNRLGLILVPLGAGSLAASVGLGMAFWCPALFLLISVAMVLRTP